MRHAVHRASSKAKKRENMTRGQSTVRENGSQGTEKCSWWSTSLHICTALQRLAVKERHVSTHPGAGLSIPSFPRTTCQYTSRSFRQRTKPHHFVKMARCEPVNRTAAGVLAHGMTISATIPGLTDRTGRARGICPVHVRGKIMTHTRTMSSSDDKDASQHAYLRLIEVRKNPDIDVLHRPRPFSLRGREAALDGPAPLSSTLRVERRCTTRGTKKS